MSPHGIAEPPDQSLRNSSNKRPLNTLLIMLNFVTRRQKCSRYPLSRICAPRKSGPNFTKIEDLLSRNAPHQVKIITSRSPTRCTRKALHNFTPFSILATPFPGPNFTNLVPDISYSKAPSVNLPNFLFF